MLCCSSCSLPVQGHQLPTGARCSILFDEAVHASGLEPECTVCLQPWGSHTWGKHIPKDCKFHQQQAPRDTATDDLEPAEDGDVHSSLTCIMQENQVIKAQLSQLTELVWQLLPQPGQATPQPADAGNTPVVPPPIEEQAAGTSRANVGLPHHLGCTLEIWHQGFHWGTNSHLYLALLGNPHCDSMAILCQQYQPHWHCLEASTHYRCTTTAALAFPSQPQHAMTGVSIQSPAGITSHKPTSSTGPCFHQRKDPAWWVYQSLWAVSIWLPIQVPWPGWQPGPRDCWWQAIPYPQVKSQAPVYPAAVALGLALVWRYSS